MKQLFAAAAAFALLSTGAPSSEAWAQSFPSKPIRVISPYAPGGQSDVVVRVVMQKFSDSIGQNFVLEPKPGAGGNLAMDFVAKSPADGYTLLLGAPLLAINASLYKKLAFDPLKDLEPVSLMAYGPYVLFGSGKISGNLAEVVALAKKEPGKLNYFSQGVGSGTHLAMVLFANAAGIDITHVPYKGFGQALPDMVSGQVHLAFNGVDAATSFVDSGQLTMLGFGSAQRSPRFPKTPAISEVVPGFEVAGWYGLWAPAGTPADVMAKLNAELVKAVKSPEISERIEAMGLHPRPQSLAEAKAFVASEVAKWGSAVRSSKANIDE